VLFEQPISSTLTVPRDETPNKLSSGFGDGHFPVVMEQALKRRR
jgi:hypothetical protein